MAHIVNARGLNATRLRCAGEVSWGCGRGWTCWLSQDKGFRDREKVMNEDKKVPGGVGPAGSLMLGLLIPYGNPGKEAQHWPGQISHG